MRLYMDDERTPPEGFVLSKTVDQTIEYLETGEVTELSLDHDMGDGTNDGTRLINWLEFAVHTDVIPLPKIIIHTMNPVARTRMMQVAMRLWRSKATEFARDDHWKLRPTATPAVVR